MDKSKLLEEFVELKRLLKDYENKQGGTLNRMKTNVNKVATSHLNRERSSSSIFLNPVKLNAVDSENILKCPEKVSNHDSSNVVGKVFINPNFRKPNLSSTPSKSSVNRELKQKQKNNHIDKYKLSISQHVYDCKKLSSDHLLPQQKKVLSNGISKSAVPNNKSLSSSSRMIFVNPEFSSSSKLNVESSDSSLLSIRSKNTANPECCKQNSETKKFQRNVAVNVCRKRKISLNGAKLTESSNNDHKRIKESENIVGPVKKIFVNPKFERKENHSKNCDTSKTVSQTSDIKVNCKVIPPSKSGSQTLAMQKASMIPVLLGGKEVPSKFTSVSYPLCTIVSPNREIKVAKKITSQRIRTRSTNLVTISATKLVRKRRLSLKIAETSGKVASQPLFVSKTKLVRNVSKRTINNSCIAKAKVKPVVQKNQAQFVSAEKLHKLRRKSLTDKPVALNHISIVPRPADVTKIKSKNGKSLKLIRKSANTSLSSATIEKLKAQNMVNNRKMQLRQQASRIATCLLQRRLKRTQFSKINVPVVISHSSGYNENIYKKNNITSRKPLTKAALVGKQEATSVLAKTQVRNTSLDMTKFIKSKYRLIRKQPSNIISRYRLCQKTRNRSTPHHKVVQRKKLKWNRKSDTSKKRLTRKDLRIKKIGGVFYRYSRTTLAKNKPLCKEVPQLQVKGIYQVTSERRQSRFCLDKNSRRKRVSLNGVPFTTSSSGMSWRRTNYRSARSILTQAKQKSIYLLTKKMKKNNEPCLFFHRYGRCSGHERGTCVRLHDKKYVAVCKKFIQGSCTDTNCSLSHAPSCHNMPTCHHFLAGQCGRDNCPYPHIKVSDCAPICLDFLKGFCSLGDQCAKRHFEICPTFEKGVCARGKYCPYPHPKNKTGENMKGKFRHIKRKQPPPSPKEAESVSTSNLRYFEDVNLQKENQICLNKDQEGSEDSVVEVEVEEVTCLKKRPQLGELPSFIPLSQSFT